VSGKVHAPTALPPGGKSLWYPVDRRLCVSQSRSGRYGDFKILDPTAIRTPNPWSSSPYPFHFTICSDPLEGYRGTVLSSHPVSLQVTTELWNCFQTLSAMSLVSAVGSEVREEQLGSSQYGSWSMWRQDITLSHIDTRVIKPRSELPGQSVLIDNNTSCYRNLGYI
jgi:hypothetical protein